MGPPRFHGLEQSTHYSGKKKKKREGVSFHLKLYQVLGLYLQLQVLTRVTPASRFGRGVTNTLRGLCLVMLPIASYAPAGVALYWTTSSVYGLIQNLVMLSPRVRRGLKIPQTPRELQQPYKHIADQIKSKSS